MPHQYQLDRCTPGQQGFLSSVTSFPCGSSSTVVKCGVYKGFHMLQVISGSMQLQVDKNGQILGTAGDVLGGMHIKGQVQKFRHALWGSQQSLAKKSSSPDLQRQSQTLPKEAAKSKPWQLARKSAPQPSSEAACSGSSNQDDASRTSLARVR